MSFLLLISLASNSPPAPRTNLPGGSLPTSEMIQGALGFGDASLASCSRAIAKAIESLGVEAMDALADRLWVAPQSSEAICVVRSSPSQLRTIIRALFIQSAGAWRLRASLRTFRSSSGSSGARARSSFGTVFSFPARRSCYALMYTAFEERSSIEQWVG
jgi:hypothetical protein